MTTYYSNDIFDDIPQFQYHTAYSKNKHRYSKILPLLQWQSNHCAHYENCINQNRLFFQFRVEISTQDTKKAAMTFSIITASNWCSRRESNPQLQLRRTSPRWKPILFWVKISQWNHWFFYPSCKSMSK